MEFSDVDFTVSGYWVYAVRKVTDLNRRKISRPAQNLSISQGRFCSMQVVCFKGKRPYHTLHMRRDTALILSKKA